MFNRRITSLALCLCFSVAVHAQPPGFTPKPNEETEDKTAEYLKNFSTYYNIDVEESQQLPIKTPQLPMIEGLSKYIIASSRLPDNVANTTLITGPLTNYQPSAQFNQSPLMPDPTLQAISNLLTTPPTELDCYDANFNCLSRNALRKNILTKLKLSQPYHFTNIEGNIYQRAKPSTEPNLSNAALSVNSLLGPLNYKPNKQQSANQRGSSSSNRNQQNTPSPEELAEFYIKLLSGQANPSMLPSEEQLKRLLENQGEAAFHEYLTRLYQYIALNSISVSNINEMQARRSPHPEQKLANLSQAQIEYQLATRRFEQKDGKDGGSVWHQQMETAPPIVIQREMLYLLNEMNYQMYLNRMQNERILATLSAIQIQGSEQMREGLQLR